MTRWVSILLLLVLAGGCAASRSSTCSAGAKLRPCYDDSTSETLAFGSPVTLGQPSIELPRDQRSPAAFVGFEDISTTFFYIRTDDRVADDGCNWTLRRAVSERVGVSYR